MKLNTKTGEFEDVYDPARNGAIRNSWGDHEKVISMKDANKGVHSRYGVTIKTLTYKGYSTGDIEMIWTDWDKEFKTQGFIYKASERGYAKKVYGIENIDKKFFDLCTDFGLTKEGEIIPKGSTIECDDF